MMKFRYQAFGPTGAVVDGEIEASSRSEASQAVELRGLTPFEIRDSVGERRGPATWRLHLVRRRLGLAERARICRELSTLLQARLPLDQALRVMSGEGNPRSADAFVAGITEAVMSGSALSDALKALGSGFPEEDVSVIRAGENSADLGRAMEDLAVALETRLELRSRISSALTYPILLLVMALISIFVVVSVLVPNLLPLFEGTGTGLPRSLAVLAAGSEAVEHHWPALLLGMLCAVLLIWLLLRQEWFRLFVDRSAWHLPLFGALLAQLETARLSRSLATLLKSGVPLPLAMSIAKDVCRNRVTRAMVGAAAEQVIAGRRLSEAIPDSPVFPHSARQLVAIGEETNRLDQVLMHVACAHESAAARRIERLMTILTPALTVALGLFVGGLIMSVMQAILSVNDLVAP
jgi:general secretion pathway protein F